MSPRYLFDAFANIMMWKDFMRVCTINLELKTKQILQSTTLHLKGRKIYAHCHKILPSQ